MFAVFNFIKGIKKIEQGVNTRVRHFAGLRKSTHHENLVGHLFKVKNKMKKKTKQTKNNNEILVVILKNCSKMK